MLESGAMDRRSLISTYRLGFGVLTVAAIVTQATDLWAKGTLVPSNFLSYFTIQSNLIAVAVFLIGVARWRTTPSFTWQLVRGAAVVQMTVTFVVFALLLADTDVDTAIPWVDFVVHTIMPIAVIADWLIDPPTHRISFGQSLRWLTYPLVWTAYTMIRGAATGWYPYPFLDPASGGYGQVAITIVAILVFGAALCAVISWVGNLLGRRAGGETAAA